MFDVFYRHSDGSDELIATCADFHTVNEMVNYYFEQHNIKSYYSRMWISAPGVLKIDFGSYSEFIIVKGPVNQVMSMLMEEK